MDIRSILSIAVGAGLILFIIFFLVYRSGSMKTERKIRFPIKGVLITLVVVVILFAYVPILTGILNQYKPEVYLTPQELILLSKNDTSFASSFLIPKGYTKNISSDYRIDGNPFYTCRYSNVNQKQNVLFDSDKPCVIVYSLQSANDYNEFTPTLSMLKLMQLPKVQYEKDHLRQKQILSEDCLIIDCFGESSTRFNFIFICKDMIKVKLYTPEKAYPNISSNPFTGHSEDSIDWSIDSLVYQSNQNLNAKNASDLQ